VKVLFETLQEHSQVLHNCIGDFFNLLCGQFSSNKAVWSTALSILAELDCFCSMAVASSKMGKPACRPSWIEGEHAFFEFEGLRNPCLLGLTQRDFVQNDIRVGGKHADILFLTGLFNVPSLGRWTNLTSYT
jgi:DNA mismatch repair protein MSH6